MLPSAGDVLLVTDKASVQFHHRPIVFRVIRALDRSTYEGWIWLDGYELNAAGDAVERREIFVQVAGLRVVSQAPARRPRNQRLAAAPAGRVAAR